MYPLYDDMSLGEMVYWWLYEPILEQMFLRQLRQWNWAEGDLGRGDFSFGCVPVSLAVGCLMLLNFMLSSLALKDKLLSATPKLTGCVMSVFPLGHSHLNYSLKHSASFSFTVLGFGYLRRAQVKYHYYTMFLKHLKKYSYDMCQINSFMYVFTRFTIHFDFHIAKLVKNRKTPQTY